MLIIVSGNCVADSAHFVAVILPLPPWNLFEQDKNREKENMALKMDGDFGRPIRALLDRDQAQLFQLG